MFDTNDIDPNFTDEEEAIFFLKGIVIARNNFYELLQGDRDVDWTKIMRLRLTAAMLVETLSEPIYATLRKGLEAVDEAFRTNKKEDVLKVLPNVVGWFDQWLLEVGYPKPEDFEKGNKNES